MAKFSHLWELSGQQVGRRLAVKGAQRNLDVLQLFIVDGLAQDLPCKNLLKMQIYTERLGTSICLYLVLALNCF